MTPQQQSSSSAPAPAASGAATPLSQQPVPTLTAILNTGMLPSAGTPPTLVQRITGTLRSRGVMVLIGVIGLGAIGAKMFWPEPPKVNVASASVKAPAKKPDKAPLKKEPLAKSKVANAEPLTIDKPEEKPAASSSPKLKAKKPGVAAEPVVEEKPLVAEKPTRVAAAAKPTTAPAPIAAAKKPTAAAATASRVVADPLGPVFIDETNGYSVRFPAGWSIRTFNGEPWVIDSGDGRSGLISIGFSPFPNGFTTESIPPEWIARRIKRRADTVLHGQGYSTVAGKRALWSKSTGPLPMTHANPRMTRVNYILPTGDGRVLELRVAAAPDQFDRLVPVMKRAVETFRLVPASNPEPVAAAGR